MSLRRLKKFQIESIEIRKRTGPQEGVKNKCIKIGFPESFICMQLTYMSARLRTIITCRL